MGLTGAPSEDGPKPGALRRAYPEGKLDSGVKNGLAAAVSFLGRTHHLASNKLVIKLPDFFSGWATLA
jgi:hypothetical protein